MVRQSSRELQQAVRSGDSLRLAGLLQRGCCPDLYWWEGELRWTALHMACQLGLTQQARVLLEAGADPNLPVEVTSRPVWGCHNGYTAWQMAQAYAGQTALALVAHHPPGVRRRLEHLSLSHGAKPVTADQARWLSTDLDLRRQGEVAYSRRELRRSWGFEAMQAGAGALARGDLAVAAEQAAEAERLLADHPGTRRLRQELHDAARLRTLELMDPRRAIAEARLLLAADPGNRSWLRFLLERAAPEEFAGLMGELEDYARSMGLQHPLPRSFELIHQLDDLPDGFAHYLSKRLGLDSIRCSLTGLTRVEERQLLQELVRKGDLAEGPLGGRRRPGDDSSILDDA